MLAARHARYATHRRTRRTRTTATALAPPHRPPRYLTRGKEEPAVTQTDAQWTPAFDGQRPPFQPGNEHAVTHGARSERHVGPLAAQIAHDLLTDPDVPPHIREPLFAASVHAWARAEAVCRLLWAWLEDRDIMAGL